MGIKLTPASEITFGSVDDGTYTAKFTGYTEPRQSKFNADLQYTNLSFLITDDDDFGGQTVDGTVTIDSKKWTEWIGALEGGVYTGSGDVDDLIGTPCVITVENKEKGENTYSNVVKVAVSRRKKKARPAPVEDFDVEFDEDDLV